MRLFLFFIVFFLELTFIDDLLAYSPQIEGLAGAGRAGIPKEALFSNPAAVGLLKQNTALLGYTQTKIKNLNAGGRVQIVGLYDGSSDYARGGLAYIRESRRRVIGSGSTYTDHMTVRTVVGRGIWQDLYGGMKINYVTSKEYGRKSEYFYGDLGLIYPLFSDLPLGITVENVTDKKGERPRSAHAGMRYDIMGPLNLYTDLGKIMSGEKSGKSVWSLALELLIFEELVIRGGLFRDSVDQTRGQGLGISWYGPRTTFEYALRQTRAVPHQVDHVFGISLVF